MKNVTHTTKFFKCPECGMNLEITAEHAHDEHGKETIKVPRSIRCTLCSSTVKKSHYHTLFE